MSGNKFNRMDIFVISILLIAALLVTIHSPQKYQPLQKINPETFIPKTLPGWVSVTHDMSKYKDGWQSINELFVRTYYRANGEYVNLIVEYSSDMRRNFSLHFPENCHRSHGNEVDFLPPLQVALPNHPVEQAKLLYIKGVPNSPVTTDTLLTYWITIDKKQFYQTFWIKIDQMVSGLIRNPKQGVLVRVDYYTDLQYNDEKSITRGKELIQQFITDLYSQLKPNEQEMLFGQ